MHGAYKIAKLLYFMFAAIDEFEDGGGVSGSGGSRGIDDTRVVVVDGVSDIGGFAMEVSTSRGTGVCGSDIVVGSDVLRRGVVVVVVAAGTPRS